MINLFTTPAYKTMLKSYGATSWYLQLRLRFKLLSLRVFGEEALPLDGMKAVLQATLVEDASPRIKPWQYLAFRKMINPFKWVAFILGSILLTLNATSHAVFHALDGLMCFFEEAIEKIFLVLGYPAFALMYVISIFFGKSKANQQIKSAAWWLIKGGMNSPAAKLGRWISRFIYVFRFILFIALSVVYEAFNVAVFLVNCITSPANAMLRPLIYSCRAGKLSGILAVVLGLLACSLIILAITMSMGAVLPAALAFLQPVVNFIAPLTALFLPVVTAISSVIGVIAAKVVVASSITLFVMTLFQRFFEGIAKFEFIKVIGNVFKIFDFNNFKGKDVKMDYFKNWMKQSSKSVNDYIEDKENNENSFNLTAQGSATVPKTNNLYPRGFFNAPDDAEIYEDLSVFQKICVEFRGLFFPFYSPTKDVEFVSSVTSMKL